MATAKQVELFNRLSTEREFPAGTNVDALKAQFATVSDKSASQWIEKALTLPERGETPPAF